MTIAQPIFGERCQFEGSLPSAVIDEVLGNKQVRVLQTSSPAGEATWKRINDRIFAKRPDIELRVYGFYSDVCDLSFLRHMGNVRRFSADCLMKAVNVDAICGLARLQGLAIGIHDLESFEFLRGLAAGGVRELSLMATKSKKPDLGILAHFAKVRTLFIEGQGRGLDAIAGLRDLRDLTLRSVSPGNLDFIKPLRHLASLDIKLGGLTDLAALTGLDTIRYLELWQVKGLSDIGVVGTMRGLQSLFLQSLANVKRIPDLSKLTRLRRITLENMKGLKDISAISTAPALEEFAHFMAMGRSPLDYAFLFKRGTVKKAVVGFGSRKKNDDFRALAAQHGVEELDVYNDPFVFR